MSNTIIKISAYGETTLVRCDLTQASAPVQVNYLVDGESRWEPTPYQCADARHDTAQLEAIAVELAARAFEVSEEDLRDEADIEQARE